MLASSMFTDAVPTPSSSNAGGIYGFMNIARDVAQGYFQYDIAKREVKAAQVQAATGYAQGYADKGYGYTGFTQDGGLVGGVAGLKGEQVFILLLATIGIFWIAKK